MLSKEEEVKIVVKLDFWEVLIGEEDWKKVFLIGDAAFFLIGSLCAHVSKLRSICLC